ncbi:MAG: YqiA/YcfP family alpha/beta fold hydrolase [Chromatiaceae bacterium]
MLIYLHGLNSSSRSYKAAVLREQLAPLRVVAPSYPAHRPDAAVERLSDCFRELPSKEPLVVVGSSMGGFYGQFLARRFPVEHLYLINPAVKPWVLLPQFEGQTMTTADGDAYLITREGVERTRAYGIDDPCDGVQTTLFLDTGDEVIDYRIAVSMYRNCGRLLVFQGGDHAFQHLDEAIAVIREGLATGRKRGADSRG